MELFWVQNMVPLTVQKLTDDPALATASWKPNTMFISFSLNQATAYVFWATARLSPPMPKMNLERRRKWCGRRFGKDF